MMINVLVLPCEMSVATTITSFDWTSKQEKQNKDGRSNESEAAEKTKVEIHTNFSWKQ